MKSSCFRPPPLNQPDTGQGLVSIWTVIPEPGPTAGLHVPHYLPLSYTTLVDVEMGFDYPITRQVCSATPYPWRFATFAIVLASSLMIMLFVYLNLAVVGMTTASTFSTTFEQPKTPSWRERLNIKKTLNFGLGCEPTTLVAGGIYRTPNGAFPYTIQSFIDTDSREVFSGVSYNGSTLNDCTLQSVGMLASVVTFDAMFEANINCTLNGTIEMLATAPALVTMRSGGQGSIQKNYDLELIRKQTKSTYMGPAIARMLVAFGLDFLNGFFSAFGDTTTLYQGFDIRPTMDFSYYDATMTYTTGASQGGNITGLFGNYTTGVAVFENFAIVFWSAVLSDLGIASPSNAFVNMDLFRQVIHSNLTDLPPDFSYSWINGTAAEYILDNPTDMHLPFNDVQPTSFNAKYLCRKITWKPITSLIIDVLVATTSFFVLFWGLLGLVLQYFATRKQVHANEGGCPNCQITMTGSNDTQKVLLPSLYSAQSGHDYKAVPQSD